MKLTKSKLKQIIKEEVAQAIKEGDVIQGPWGKPEEDPGIVGGELPAEYQYEYVLDELVDAARDAVMPLAIEKLKKVGGYRIPGETREPGMSGYGRQELTSNDIELEIEEGLLDALKPLAKIIQSHRDLTAEEDKW